MTKPSFADIQKDTIAMITKIKDSDPEHGAYLKKHIIIDEENETLTYTGDPEIIADILSRAIVS